MSSLGARHSSGAIFLWRRPCDARLEELRDAFAKATEDAKRKELATAIQVRMSEYPTHVPLGQFNVPSVLRATVTGSLEAPAPVFWNVKKKAVGRIQPSSRLVTPYRPE